MNKSDRICVSCSYLIETDKFFIKSDLTAASTATASTRNEIFYINIESLFSIDGDNRVNKSDSQLIGFLINGFSGPDLVFTNAIQASNSPNTSKFEFSVDNEMPWSAHIMIEVSYYYAVFLL
jgi:hypothetical protein